MRHNIGSSVLMFDTWARDHEWDSNAALPNTCFPPVKRAINVSQITSGISAIISQIDDVSIVTDFQFFDLVKYSANTLV